ncbi:MAG: MBL fold metallo-hydrolase [Clostridiales bacterium]|jgi:glyoxylase-like metal-dependent hydrolase (beta-lactamase superfamily II)|nr:MBL fold metallo-hydrolase [Clostridiales bacterium]
MDKGVIHIASYIILGILLLILVFIFTRFRPAATGEITKDIYSINAIMMNFYALKTSEGVVLFDAGINPAVSASGLRKLNLAPESVTHVFLTHSDFDHAGGLKAFPNARVYISEAEERMVNGTTARRGFMRNRLPTPYKTLKDKETFNIGGKSVQARLTPGHTPGSVTYYVDGGRVLVTGDLLRLTGGGEIKPFLILMNMDQEKDAQSTEAIKPDAEKAEYILTGHTGVKQRNLS